MLCTNQPPASAAFVTPLNFWPLPSKAEPISFFAESNGGPGLVLRFLLTFYSLPQSPVTSSCYLFPYLRCRQFSSDRHCFLRGKRSITGSVPVQNCKGSASAFLLSSFREKCCLQFKFNPFCFVLDPLLPSTGPY